jgi:hypothetical protein
MSNQLGITQKYSCGMMITVKEGCRMSAEERQKGIENMFENILKGFFLTTKNTVSINSTYFTT